MAARLLPRNPNSLPRRPSLAPSLRLRRHLLATLSQFRSQTVRMARGTPQTAMSPCRRLTSHSRPALLRRLLTMQRLLRTRVTSSSKLRITYEQSSFTRKVGPRIFSTYTYTYTYSPLLRLLRINY